MGGAAEGPSAKEVKAQVKADMAGASAVLGACAGQLLGDLAPIAVHVRAFRSTVIQNLRP